MTVLYVLYIIYCTYIYIPVYCWSVELVTSALVVATVSAKATRNICSSLVSPGRLECMR